MSLRTPLLICVLALVPFGGGCASRLQGEELGGGFTRVALQAESDHLYFRGADLGAVGFVSVAPSGGFAIFERDGEIFLIESELGTLRPVTDGEFSPPRQVRWDEAEGIARIDYANDRPSTTIELN